MRRFVGMAVAGCVALGPAWAEPPATVEHDALDAILAATVRGEGVDYPAIRDRHLEVLDGYLDRLAAADAGALEPDRRLALLINLYNATMIRAVVGRFTPDWSPGRAGQVAPDVPGSAQHA